MTTSSSTSVKAHCDRRDTYARAVQRHLRRARGPLPNTWSLADSLGSWNPPQFQEEISLLFTASGQNSKEDMAWQFNRRSVHFETRQELAARFECREPRLKMRRLSLQELAVAQLADEFAVANLHFAANGDRGRPAFELPAFERAVIDVHLLRLRGNLAAILRDRRPPDRRRCPTRWCPCAGTGRTALPPACCRHRRKCAGRSGRA